MLFDCRAVPRPALGSRHTLPPTRTLLATFHAPHVTLCGRTQRAQAEATLQAATEAAESARASDESAQRRLAAAEAAEGAENLPGTARFRCKRCSEAPL
eukprot:127113-Chlamydomonas_euryale.AAC.5